MSYIEQAKQIIYGARNEDYGPMKDSFDRTAKIWSAILNIEVTPHQVCLCMMGLKLSRESFKQKDDNIVDIIGYAEISGIIKNNFINY